MPHSALPAHIWTGNALDAGAGPPFRRTFWSLAERTLAYTARNLSKPDKVWWSCGYPPPFPWPLLLVSWPTDSLLRGGVGLCPQLLLLRSGYCPLTQHRAHCSCPFWSDSIGLWMRPLLKRASAPTDPPSPWTLCYPNSQHQWSSLHWPIPT